MSQPDESANVASSWAKWQRSASISLAFMTLPFDSLLRAVAFCGEEGWGLALIDIERVEAMWEMLDAFSTSHGFVLALTGRRRVYLQYISDNEAGDVQLLPMTDERYPDLQGGGIKWTDDVGDLNRFLKS
ncbi:hypothetical protein BH10PSE6_BH10PSE6_54690 [soil metagenome]